MKKRMLPLLLSLVLILPMLSSTSFAVNLPDGWWPVWSAYTEARGGTDVDAILAKGDAVLSFYANKTRTVDIAEHQYNIYLVRMERGLYEQRGEYDKAAQNAKNLAEVSQWLTRSGVDRSDVVTYANAHLELVTPMTGVYGVSYTQSNTYGSHIAAASGTYYGTNHEGALVSDGSASVASVYINLENETAQTFGHYISDLDDGERVIQINLNFLYEGNTARSVPSGAYDSNLRSTLSYLDGLDSPVLLRIATEMNVWTTPVTPAEYIAAYNYIGAMARSLAPDVELIWAPNCVGSWGSDPAAYYPSDAYVDWVGLSLYYNYDTTSTKQDWLEFSRAGRFADPIACAEAVVKMARAHNKPVSVTEGGAAKNDSMGESWAVGKTAKEFSTLTMVYPEVKSIIHFDKSINGNDYTLTGSMRSAVKDSIAKNPTLITRGEDAAGTYVPLKQLNEKVTGGKVTIGATGRTYQSMDMSATYKLDGKVVAATSGSPNLYELDLSALSYGKHKLEVTLSDGKGYTKTETYNMSYSSNGVVNMDDNSPAASTPSSWAQSFVDEGDSVGMIPDSVKKNYQAAITRAQFAEMLVQALELGKKDLPLGQAFSDCSLDYVRKARGIGMVDGTGDNAFNPNANVSRQEMVTMLLRAREYMAEVGGYDLPGAIRTTSTSDPIYAGVSGWALGFMKTGYEAGIISGDGNTLNPLGNATCQEAIIMVLQSARAYFEALGIMD